ncbi:MAG: helix-turn-helix transcriptional regulator [Alistipes sp.]|nr:helix-turn-helix transcriptional regulator [Alistipes sp.]
MEKLTDFQVFIKVNKLKQKQVAEYLGTSTQYVNQVVNGKCSLSEDKLELLANSQWDTSMLDIPPYINIKPAVMTPLDGGEATPMMPIQANIDTGEVSEKKIEPIPATAEVIPIVPSEVASEVNLDVRKFIEHNADELEHIDPTKLLKNPDLAEQIAGTSMLPTFAPNDVVFVKFLPDKAKIIDGKTYYFDTKTFPTMIRKVKFESENKLRLIAKNPAFADIIISRSDVQNVGRVIGLFRQTFGDQYDEIEEVRRRKDSQIDKLLDQNSKALESIGELIEVIKDKRG